MKVQRGGTCLFFRSKFVWEISFQEAKVGECTEEGDKHKLINMKKAFHTVLNTADRFFQPHTHTHTQTSLKVTLSLTQIQAIPRK